MSKNHQLFCGKCRRPLGDGMATTVIDSIEGVCVERKARFCDNPECGAEVYVIEETAEPRRKLFSWRQLFARRLPS